MSVVYEDQTKWRMKQNHIYSNFNDKEFITHFKLTLSQFKRNSKSSEPNAIISYPCRKKRKDTINKKKQESSSDSIYKKEEKGIKKLIIHLVPSKESNFYNSMIEKKQKVSNECGIDETYKYDTHISVTGYFFCSDVNLFLATLYMYFYYYIKFLNYNYVNLSLNIKLNNMFRKNNFYALYTKHKSKKPNQIIQQTLIHMKQKWKLTNIGFVENKEIVSVPPNQNIKKKEKRKEECNEQRDTYLLATEDGYVIIPVLCEWIQKIFENFYWVIKSNNFTYYNKHKTKMNLLKKKPSSTDDNNMLCDSLRTQRVNSDIHVQCQKENQHQHQHGQDIYSDSSRIQNETIKEEGEEEQDTLFNRRYSQKEKRNNINSSEVVSMCSTQVEDFQSERKTKQKQTKNFTNQYKKMKILKKKNKENTQKPNEVKYKFNNSKVKITDFRIKQWNHISLASNRHNQNVVHTITNIYKDINMKNCSWDLVIYKYDETHIQEKHQNNFLNEIFRLKHFAVS